MNPKPKFIYIAFDVFPSQKGAATHINHCLKALQNTFETGLLICLGTDEMPAFQYDDNRQLYVYRWKEKVVNFLERTQKFQKAVSKILQLPLCENVQLVHFRDIWGGIPVLQNKNNYKSVFEVNAFQHIELPNRYTMISASVLDKIKVQEQFCISQADAIITPSKITKAFIHKHFDNHKHNITVIPNGVSLYETRSFKEKNKRTSPYIIYFGALQKWQGIKTLFKAFKELEDLDLRLQICASVPEKRTIIFKELAINIGISHRVDWYYELDKQTLANHIKGAELSVAPLASCNRNIVQGCNPLKILESMSYATPVVASNIPVVRELIEHQVTGFLVLPDRPEHLGRMIRELLQKPELLKQVGNMAEQLIKKNYLWEDQELKMITVYKQLLAHV
jgi:glycosyltransferase involved in cell wall biosynthesis